MGFLQEDSWFDIFSRKIVGLTWFDMMPVTSTGQIPVEKASIHLTTCRANP